MSGLKSRMISVFVFAVIVFFLWLNLSVSKLGMYPSVLSYFVDLLIAGAFFVVFLGTWHLIDLVRYGRK